LEKVRHEVEPSSYGKYEREVRLRLAPGLGKVQLSKLTPQQVQAFYARKLNEGASASTVAYMHGVLAHALYDALRLGLLHRNVCDVVDAPRVLRREIHPLTEEQMRTLLAAAEGDRLQAPYVLALSTGMRRSELAALHWDAVDVDDAVVHVRANLQKVPGGGARRKPKTKHSRRTIALTAAAVEALRRHRLRQAEERLRLGPVWADPDVVFPNTVGNLFDPDHLVHREFKPLLRRSGLPDIHFHDLRHTCATLLLARGVNPKVVSEMLGHASIAITLGTYGHVLPHMQKQAAALMDEMLGGRDAG
jgi:integrase